MVDHENGPRPAPFNAGGDFSVHGSNFAGGDQHIGDHVHGNKVGGNKITKNNIRVRLGLGEIGRASCRERV